MGLLDQPRRTRRERHTLVTTDELAEADAIKAGRAELDAREKALEARVAKRVLVAGAHERVASLDREASLGPAWVIEYDSGRTALKERIAKRRAEQDSRIAEARTKRAEAEKARAAAEAERLAAEEELANLEGQEAADAADEETE